MYFKVSLVVVLNANETSNPGWPSLVEGPRLAYAFKTDYGFFLVPFCLFVCLSSSCNFL